MPGIRTTLLFVAVAIYALPDQAAFAQQSLFGNNSLQQDTGRTSTRTTGTEAGTTAATGVQINPTQIGLSTNTEFGTNSFVGRGATDTFIGRGQTQNQTGRGNNAAQFNQFGRQGNQFNRGGGFNQFGNTGGRTRQAVRPRLQIAFSHRKIESSLITTSLSQRMARLPLGKVAGAGITFVTNDSGQVTLRGEVDSARTMKLAAILARFEPGVRSVKNELTVKTSSATPEPPTASP